MNHRCRGLAFCLAGAALIVVMLVCGPGRVEPEAGQSVAPVRLSRESGFYDDPFLLAMDCDAGEIRYTLDGSEPTMASPRYELPFVINRQQTVTARAFRDGRPIGEPRYKSF